jgi:hypothetical protein
MLGCSLPWRTPTTPGPAERYYKNMQDDAVITRILGMVSLDEDDKEEEMPEEDSPGEDKLVPKSQ